MDSWFRAVPNMPAVQKEEKKKRNCSQVCFHFWFHGSVRALHRYCGSDVCLTVTAVAVEHMVTLDVLLKPRPAEEGGDEFKQRKGQRQ